MNKRINLLIMCFLFSGVTFSQEMEKKEEQSLSEITVTANKFEQKSDETGKNITIISREKLRQSSGMTVSQLLQNQSGITIAGANNNLGAVQTIFMRGAASGNTLILLNGVPLNDPSQISNTTFDLNLISVDFLEKIEIVKNAQSSLYGSDASAGVINLITTKTNAEKISTIFGLQAGSFATLNGNLGFSAAKENSYVNVMLNYKKTKGFSEAASPDVTIFEKDNSNVIGALVNAGKSFGTNKLRFTALLNQINNGTDNGAFQDEHDYKVLSNYASLGLGFDKKLLNTSLTANIKYDLNNHLYENDSSWVAPNSFGKYSKSTSQSSGIYAEIFSKYKFNDNVSALVGSDFRTFLTNQKDNYDGFLSEIKNANSSISSIYGVILLNLKSYNAELGGRINIHSIYGLNSTFNFSPSAKINEHFRVFGSVASGFKAPSLYQLYSSYGNDKLKPEETLTSEIGSQFTSKNTNIKLAYFIRNGKNVFFYQSLTSNPWGKYINFDKQNDYGFEVEAIQNIGHKIIVSANYTYVEGKTNSKDNLDNPLTINYLIRRAKHTFNNSIKININKGNSFLINTRIVGKRKDLFFNETTFQTESIILNSYAVLTARYDFTINSKYKTFLQLNNITNSKYFDIYGYSTSPFNFLVGFSAKL